MASQNGEAGPSPLAFDELEDIPAIDGEDDAHVPGDITHSGVASSVTAGDGNPLNSSASKENNCHDDKKEIVENSSSNENKTDLDQIGQEGEPDGDEKAQEEVSCTDDAPSVSVASSTAEGGGEPAEECVTHSFSFTFRSPEAQAESNSSKKEPESKLEDSSVSELQPPDDASKLKSKTKKVKKAASRDSRDSDSSVSSKKRGKSSKARIKSKFAPGSFEYIEERLRGQIFSGWIEERRWVENLAGYRDVIEVDEWEVEMNQILMCVIRSIPGVLERKKWINITPPSESEPSFRLWTLLTQPPTPGHFWFSVSGVAVHPQFGLRVMVKIIRNIHPHDGELAKARRKRRKELASREPGKELETLSEQVQEWLHEIRQINLSSIWSAISSTLTLSNIREAIRFIIVLSMTIVVGFVAFVRESHHYGIQFLHAAGVFFRNITPFLQSLLAFFEKIIGGMYLLLAMVYNDVRRSSRQPPHVSQPPPPPMAITDRSQGFSPMPPGPRTVKYVPPEQWVYKSQNNSTDR